MRRGLQEAVDHPFRPASNTRPLFSKVVLNLWAILRLGSHPPVDQLPLDAS
jgi:hypothetical protein